MRQTSAKWITAGYVLSLLMLGCIGVISYFSFQRLIEEKQWVNHTYQVLGELGAVAESELSAGQGRKDDLPTSDRASQQVYAVHRQQIFDLVNRLRVLTRDNPVQQQHLARLEQLLTQQDVLQSKMLQPSSRSAGTGLTVNSANLRLVQQNIESLLVAMKAEEQRLLQHRTNQTDLMIRRVSWIAALGYGFGIALLLWMFRLLLRQFRLTQRLAEERLQKKRLRQKLQRCWKALRMPLLRLTRSSDIPS
jgi:CHASE3 domain sensor protein